MTCGVIARGDAGGLAAQTGEMARHVSPAKILLVDLGERGRGPTDRHRYDNYGAEVRVCEGIPKHADWQWLLTGVDCIYTAEATYDDSLARRCADRDVELVIHANPELWRDSSRGPTTRVYLPTAWEARRVKDASVLPVPVARDRLPFRQRTEAGTFLFPAGPAMKDRNGYSILMASLRHLRVNAKLVVSPWHREKVQRHSGYVNVEHRVGTPDYWTVYDDADVLVLPRRYGGLSLPIQEAASAGLAIVTLDLDPYRSFVHSAGLVGVTRPEKVPMKGGVFDVWGANPKELALVMRRLVAEPGLVAEMSAASGAWAATLDWGLWEGEWRRTLRA